MSPFSTLRRLSRSSTRNKDPQSPSTPHSKTASTGAASLRSSGGGGTTATNGLPHISNPIQQQSSTGITPMNQHPSGINSDMRPTSSGTDGSFDFANRPVTGHSHQPMPSTTSAMIAPSSYRSASISRSVSSNGGLSRTDQIVLKHFWEFKSKENDTRDLHYLKFPFFPQFPAHNDLMPYCEIYHLIKTSPGASIVSLGSANGVYIGFELQAGSQLHIDMDDEWHNIAHYRVNFKPYDTLIRDAASENVFKTWPKPLTIEFLEEEYQRWCLDLMSLCWEGKEVRELGGAATPLPAQSAQSLRQRQSSGNNNAGLSTQPIPAVPSMTNGNLPNGSKKF